VCTVAVAGGKYISVQENVCYFWNEDGSRVLSLNVWACDSANVEVALKDAREKVLDFPPLERTEK
jgi:hypothetical protein